MCSLYVSEYFWNEVGGRERNKTTWSSEWVQQWRRQRQLTIFFFERMKLKWRHKRDFLMQTKCHEKENWVLVVQIDGRHESFAAQHESESLLLWPGCRRRIRQKSVDRVDVEQVFAVTAFPPSTTSTSFVFRRRFGRRQRKTDLWILVLVHIDDVIWRHSATPLDTLHTNHFVVRLAKSVRRGIFLARRRGVGHGFAAGDHLIQNGRAFHT